MYTKEKRVKRMRIVGMIFSAVGTFEIVMSVWNIISLIFYYSDNLETVLRARSTPQSIRAILVGSLLLLAASKLKAMVEDANFFSGYFEGDLDGYVAYQDLADVTGKKKAKIKKQLYLLHRTCMKNFELQEIDGIEQVVLNSKKYMCECKNCGAPVEKSVYFTGKCVYCGSSDLFAKVLADNRFYSISTDVAKGVKRPEFYLAPNLSVKRVLSLVIIGLAVCIMVIMGVYALDCLNNYHDEEYMRELLLSGEQHFVSFEVFKKDMVNAILWAIAIILAFIPAVVGRVKGLSYISVADTCSEFFAGYKAPFVRVEELPVMDSSSHEKKVDMTAMRCALKKRYLQNCTLEKHRDVLMVALAKSIVKDKCPSCNGDIVGAVDEHYRCRYCGNVIMNVVRKK